MLSARLRESDALRPELETGDPQQVLSLLEQADAFRRPERFAQWLEVLAAWHAAEGLPVQKSAALLTRVRQCLSAAAAIQLSDADIRSHQGPQIGALLRERRLAALRPFAR